MRNNLNKFAQNNPNWPVLFVLLIPLCCLGWVLFPFVGSNASYNPTWSPVEDNIAFECVFLTKEDIFSGEFAPIYDFNLRDICIKKIGDIKPERLTDSRRTYAPSWSSDGRYLAWIYSREKIIIWDSVRDTYEHYPSGKELAYDDMAGDHLLWINNDTEISLQGRGILLDIEKGEYQYLPEEFNGKRIGSYSLSPNREFSLITYDAREDNDSRVPLWKLQVFKDDISISKPLTTIPSYEIPAWSPDGNYVAWVGDDNSGTLDSVVLMITNCLTGDTTRILIPELRDISDLTWSNDANRIVFISFFDKLHILDLDINSHTYEIKVIKHHIQEIPDKHLNSPISLSPSGDKASYAKRHQGEGKVIIIDIKTK